MPCDRGHAEQKEAQTTMLYELSDNEADILRQGWIGHESMTKALSTPIDLPLKVVKCAARLEALLADEDVTICSEAGAEIENIIGDLIGPKIVEGIPDLIAIQLVRESIYMQRAIFPESDNPFSNRFAVSFTAPYGKAEDVTTLREAVEAFRELIAADDWEERTFQVWDANTGKVHQFCPESETDENEGDDLCDICMSSGVQVSHTWQGKTVCVECAEDDDAEHNQDEEDEANG